MSEEFLMKIEDEEVREGALKELREVREKVLTLLKEKLV